MDWERKEVVEYPPALCVLWVSARRRGWVVTKVPAATREGGIMGAELFAQYRCGCVWVRGL